MEGGLLREGVAAVGDDPPRAKVSEQSHRAQRFHWTPHLLARHTGALLVVLRQRHLAREELVLWGLMAEAGMGYPIARGTPMILDRFVRLWDY